MLEPATGSCAGTCSECSPVAPGRCELGPLPSLGKHSLKWVVPGSLQPQPDP